MGTLSVEIRSWQIVPLRVNQEGLGLRLVGGASGKRGSHCIYGLRGIQHRRDDPTLVGRATDSLALL